MKLVRFLACCTFILVLTAAFVGCYSEDASKKFVERMEAKPGGGKDAKFWVKKIGDPAETTDAFKYLTELKDKSVVPDLVKLFDKDKAHRGDIAMVLAAIGDTSVVPVLINGVTYEVSDKIEQQQINDRTNEKIALALAKLNDPAAKPVIVKLLDAKAANVITAAVKAETVFKDPAAVPKLMEIIRRDMLARNIRSDTVKVLGDIGDPRAVPDIVRAMYVEKGGTIYPEASYALTQIGSPAVPVLVKTLERKNEEVEALGKGFIKGAIEAKAADTLGWICDKSSYDSLAKVLQKVKADDDNPIATAKTAFALARLQDKRAVGLISRYVEDEEDPTVRQHYLLSLNLLGDRSVMKVLFKSVKKPDIEKYRKEGATELELKILKDARSEVVRTIARLGGEKDLPDYEKMLKDEKDQVVKAVMEEYLPMLKASKDCGEKLDCWIGKLGDQSKIVREKAAYQIGRTGGDAAAEALVKLIDDKEQPVQFAALQGIYNMADKNGAMLLQLVQVKETQMEKARREKMAEDLKLLKLRLAKAAEKK